MSVLQHPMMEHRARATCDSRPCPLCGRGKRAPLPSSTRSAFVECAGCGLTYTTHVSLQGRNQCSSRLPLFVFRARPGARALGLLAELGAHDERLRELALDAGYDVASVHAAVLKPERHALGPESVRPLGRRLEDLAVQCGGFRIVTLLEVLDRAADPLEVLGRVQPLVQPAGALIVKVRSVDVWRKRKTRAQLTGGDLAVAQYFSPSTLAKVLLCAGLTPERIYAAPWAENLWALARGYVPTTRQEDSTELCPRSRASEQRGDAR